LVLLGLFIQIAIEIGIEIESLIGDHGLILPSLTFDSDSDSDFDGADARFH